MAGEGSGAIDRVTAAGQKVIDQVLHIGIDGFGPFKGAIAIADEALRTSKGDVEVAVHKAARVHIRLAATNGAVTGLGGFLTLPITVPVGLGGYYLLGARLAATVAHLRGHDVHSEDVRSAVLLVMLGSAATEVLRDVGVEIGKKSLAEAVKKVPGKIYIEINKKIGFRLITKAGQKGAINFSKLVPLIGAPIGGTIDGVAMKGVATYARSAFPQVS